MANAQSGSIHYVDSTGTLRDDKQLKISAIIVTATSANAVVNFQDYAGTYNLLNLRVATSGATQHFNFYDRPLVCPNGLKVNTLTNAIVTVIYTTTSG